MTKLLTGALIVSVALSAGGYALASNTKTTTKAQSSYADVKHPGKGPGCGFSKDQLKTKLDAFVKSGTITQDQENKIIAYMEKMESERKAEMDKVKNMTEEQRKTYFEQDKDKLKADPFKGLVDQKIINKAQADTIKKSMPQNHRHGKRFSSQEMKTFLASQVKAGAITQSEADKINSYINKKQAERKTEMDKVKSMTETERKAYFEQKKATPKSNFFDDLVKEGILSQTKADALKKSMKASFEGREGHSMERPDTQNTTEE